MPGKIVLAGGSGFLGQLLAGGLEKAGYEIVTLTRSPRAHPPHGRDLAWDGETAGAWADALEGAGAVINVTGRSIDCRHTQENRRKIIDSRVNSVRVVGEAIARCSQPPTCWVQAGSLAIYGDPGDRVCDESAPHGPGSSFTVEVCNLWERAFEEQVTPRTRKCFLRIGLVFGADGGFLEKLAGLARIGLGGTVGSGRQYISWVHEEDFIRLVRWTSETPTATGIYNATAPTPVTNREFQHSLRKAVHRHWSPPAPAFAVRIGAFLMGTEPSLALGGRRCVSSRLPAEGFEFRHTDLDTALHELVG
jgi:uncharacterized protein (TIGR01777 family)